MKAILSTTLVGLLLACSQQPPASSPDSPEMKSTTEPVIERAHTNATGGSNETTASGLAPTAPETVEPSSPPAANAPASAADGAERANSVATPRGAPNDARANRPDGDRERAD